MNKFLVLICLLLLGFIAWREKANLLEWKDKAVARVAKMVSPDYESVGDETATAPSDADSPAPGSGNSTAATKPAPVLVKLPDPPEGVYYLRERVSVKMDVGVRGYAAGTKVTKTGENLGMATVTDGSNTFSVENDKLTRDMNVVLEIQRKAAEDAAKKPAPVKKAAPTSATDPAKTTRETRHRYLLAQSESLDRQIHSYNKQIIEADETQRRARAGGKMSSASASVPEFRKKVDQLMRDRASIASQLAALPP